MPRPFTQTLILTSLTLSLTSCGGGGDSFLPDALKSISISKVECPIASDGSTTPPNTTTRAKAYASLIGIKNSDLVWSWDADPAVTLYTHSKNDNTSTIDLKAPGSVAKYKINVHVEADGKRADATCELEVK